MHTFTIGNLTVRADPSVRTAASISIEESARPLSELDARRAAPALASLERAGVMRSEGELVPILVDPHCEATDLPSRVYAACPRAQPTRIGAIVG